MCNSAKSRLEHLRLTRQLASEPNALFPAFLGDRRSRKTCELRCPAVVSPPISASVRLTSPLDSSVSSVNRLAIPKVSGIDRDQDECMADVGLSETF